MGDQEEIEELWPAFMVAAGAFFAGLITGREALTRFLATQRDRGKAKEASPEATPVEAKSGHDIRVGNGMVILWNGRMVCVVPDGTTPDDLRRVALYDVAARMEIRKRELGKCQCGRDETCRHCAERAR